MPVATITTRQPWRRERSPLPSTIPTMISPEERRYLYWLARTRWRGEGHIVEMGPWLGGSTFCLAAGMAAAGLDVPGSRKLHVFDNFTWRRFMAGRGGPVLPEGASFETHFRENLAPHRDRLVVHNAWLPDDEAPMDPELSPLRQPVPEDAERVSWSPDQPVEILFVDGAKSWQGMIALLETFADAWLPGRTLLVFQDYKYWGEYWVAAIVELLADALVFEHQLRENTVTFRVAGEVDRERVSSLPKLAELHRDQLCQLIERAARRLAEDGDTTDGLIVELTKVRMLVHKSAPAAAVAAFREIESRWPLLLCGTSLEAARAWLARASGKELPGGFRCRARQATDRLLRSLRR